MTRSETSIPVGLSWMARCWGLCLPNSSGCCWPQGSLQTPGNSCCLWPILPAVFLRRLQVRSALAMLCLTTPIRPGSQEWGRSDVVAMETRKKKSTPGPPWSLRLSPWKPNISLEEGELHQDSEPQIGPRWLQVGDLKPFVAQITKLSASRATCTPAAIVSCSNSDATLAGCDLSSLA